MSKNVISVSVLGNGHGMMKRQVFPRWMWLELGITPHSVCISNPLRSTYATLALFSAQEPPVPFYFRRPKIGVQIKEHK